MFPKHILSRQQGLVMQGRHLDPNFTFQGTRRHRNKVNLSLFMHQWSLLIEMEPKPRSSYHSLSTASPGRRTYTNAHCTYDNQFSLFVVVKFYKVKVKSLSRVQLFATHGLLPTRLLRPWDFAAKSTGVGCHCLLQKIFTTQGSNPGLPHCRQMLSHLSHFMFYKVSANTELVS